MIVDGTQIVDLSPQKSGNANVQLIEPGDTQIRVPPIIQPTIQVIRRTTLAPDATTEQLNSFLREFEQTRTNQAAITQNFCRLSDGRWRIHLSLGSWFNYAGAVGVEGTSILFSIGGTAVRIMSRYPSIGSFHDLGVFEVLAVDTFRIQITNGITGVGESNALRVMVNAAKLL